MNRHTFNRLKNIKYFNNLVLYLSWLLFEEILEIVLICYDLSIFHTANVTYKLHLRKYNNLKNQSVLVKLIEINQNTTES